MVSRILCLFITVICFSFTTPSIIAQDCPLPPRLLPQTFAKVIDDTPNRVRGYWVTDAEIIGEIPPDGVFEVLSVAICNEGFNWFYVNYQGIAGYTVEGENGEYWLEQTEAPEQIPYIPPVVTLNEDAITIDTVAGLHSNVKLGDGWVIDMMYSPKNTTLAVSTTETLTLYDLESYSPYTLYNGRTNTLEYSPDGALLAAMAQDGVIRIWDTETRQVKHSIQLETIFNVLVFSLDGTSIAGLSNTHLLVWDIENNRQKLWDDDFGRGSYRSDKLAFTTDGNSLIFGSTEKVYRLNLTSGTLTLLYEWLADWTLSLDTRTLVVLPTSMGEGVYQEMVVFDVATGVTILERDLKVWMDNNYLEKMLFAPDNQLILTVDRNTVLSVRSVDELRPLRDITSNVSTLEFSSDKAYMAVGSYDGTVRLFTTPQLNSEGAIYIESLYALTGLDNNVIRIVFSSDNQFVAATDAFNSITIWDITTGEKVRELRNFTPPFLTVEISPNGEKLVIGGEDSNLYLYENDALKSVFYKHEAPVVAASFSPDSSQVLSLSDKYLPGWRNVSQSVRLWDTNSGQELKMWRPQGEVENIAFINDFPVVVINYRLLGISSSDENNMPSFILQFEGFPPGFNLLKLRACFI